VQLRAQKQQCILDIHIAAVPYCLDQHALDLKRIFSGIPLHESSEDVWQARQDLFDAEYTVVMKVSVVPSEMCAVISELQPRAATDGVEICAVAQANGLMTIGLNSAADAMVASIEYLRNRVRGSGGSVVVLQLPDEMRAQLDVWGCDSNALPLMREIKRRFDPKRILNPGRFVGNI
jgi:glycolate oxidase FAD binding subunit